MAGEQYRHALRSIVELIEEASVGTAIPTERDLAARLNVSRGTIRRVVARLVDDGILKSEQGRGTFVASPPISQPLRMTSFSDEMLRRGLRPGGELLGSDTRLAEAELAEHLNVGPEDRVLEVRRLRTANGVPLALETLWTPLALVRGLDAQRLGESSFYDLLERDFGHRVADGSETIGADCVWGEDARLLGVPSGSPVLDFRRTARTEDAVVVEHTWSRYRGDKYRILADLKLPALVHHGVTGRSDFGE